MGKFIKLFRETNQYAAYSADTTNFILPNVSLCRDNRKKVYYNPYAVPNSIITYEASAKLPETTSSSEFGLHTNAFNVPILSHDFAGGVGTIEFNGVLTNIGDGAFQVSTSMTKVYLPSTVTSIGNGAFQTCSGLTSIDIPNTVTSIGNYAFTYCFSLTSVTMPSNATSIGAQAFSNCSGLTSVTIPSGVTSISNQLFLNCAGLTSVTIHDSVTSIGNGAFQSCSGLTEIEIPSGVTNIGQRAFCQCSNLATITCYAMVAPTIQGDTFYEVSTNGTLYFVASSTGYDAWMDAGDYYLGKYNWTSVEFG